VAALDPGDFSVEELVVDPAQEGPISLPRRIEAGGTEVELELFAGNQHLVIFTKKRLEVEPGMG
jgi:hypothetical protein